MSKEKAVEKSTKRVTLDLSPRLFERLEKLQETVDADSKASLIRDALQVYEYIVSRSLAGFTFKAVPKKGESETIRFVGVAGDEPM